MKTWRGVAMVGLVLAMVATASANAAAASYGSSSQYKLIGFTADSKHVYFERHDEGMEDSSVWLRVVNVTSGKQVKAVRVEYYEDGERALSAKQSKSIRAKLYASYGEPIAATLRGKDELDATWKVGESAVETKLVQIGKLGDPMEIGDAVANFDLSLQVTGKSPWKAEKKVYAPTIENDFNGNIQEWPELYLQELSLSPGGEAVAIVFGRKPFVLRKQSADEKAKAKAKAERKAKRRAKRKKR